MLAAMDVVGNPASVHAEGRAAKAMVERARGQVAALLGCEPTQVVFTGSATEAAALAVAQKNRHSGNFAALPTEHDCLFDWSDADLSALNGTDGHVTAETWQTFATWVTQRGAEPGQDAALVAISAANSETGTMTAQRSVMSNLELDAGAQGTVPFAVVCDITQMAGKTPVLFAGDKRPA